MKAKRISKAAVLIPAILAPLLTVFSACATPRGTGSVTVAASAGSSYSTQFPRAGRDSLMADTAPRSGVPMFFACSPRLSDREAELDFCLTEAAGQASRFVAVEAEAQIYREKGGVSSGMVRAMSVRFDPELAESLKQDLVLLESARDDEGTCALYSLPTRSLSIGFAPAASRKGEPAWIAQPPDIPGYLVGVGSSPRKRLFGDSVNAADEKALEELIKQISLNIVSGSLSYTAQGMGSWGKETGTEYSKAVVSGFYILARFRSEGGDTFYSLAVLRGGRCGGR